MEAVPPIMASAPQGRQTRPDVRRAGFPRRPERLLHQLIDPFVEPEEVARDPDERVLQAPGVERWRVGLSFRTADGQQT